MPKNLLLILPLTFYGFGKTLSKSLEARGYVVQMDNDEFPANVWGKILGKLGLFAMLRRITLRHYQQRYRAGSDSFDTVLIVKGRGVGPALIDHLRSLSRHVIGYNFDSFGFNPSPLAWKHAANRYCTFDIQDARDHHLPLVHLFSALPPGAGTSSKRIDVSVLMKNHSQRLAYVDQVLGALPPGVSTRIFIFETNALTAVVGALRSPRLYRKYWRHIHFTALPYEQFLDALGQSRVTVDFAHPSQTGITIRCFEAASLGVSVITNNRYTLDHPFFSSGAAAHVPLGAEPESFRDAIERLLTQAPALQARGVDDFLNELLMDSDHHAPTGLDAAQS